MKAQDRSVTCQDCQGKQLGCIFYCLMTLKKGNYSCNISALDKQFRFETDADWEPRLYPYQQEGANVLFFTFINPENMKVPESFKKLGQYNYIIIIKKLTSNLWQAL